MRYLHTSCLFLLLITFQAAMAQSGCPGCVTTVPAAFPADTLYLQPIPDGLVGTPYNQDVSFRMPKSTTPVYAIDSITPPGFDISKIKIVNVTGLPPGLFWEPSKFEFNTGSGDTDGCIKICGTPTQSDSFVLTVTVKATVFIIEQESSFPMRMYIAPKQSISEGFTMENFEGCAPLTVSFTNNVPSGGNPGFHYAWSFGDGLFSTAENPAPYTYTQPGTYVVNYQALVDTSGYQLQGVKVLDVDCTDLIGFGGPDLYLQILDQNSNVIFDSSPDVNDTPLPYTFPIGIPLQPGANYLLKVIDNDGGIKGTDDDCGSLVFNTLSNDTINAGGLSIVLLLNHLTDTIHSIDTVLVFAPPPSGAFANQQNLLSVVDTALLPMSHYGLQWTLNGTVLPGAEGYQLCALESGLYGLVVTDLATGCTSTFSSFVQYDPNVECASAVNDLQTQVQHIMLFPNPSSGVVQWQWPDSDIQSGRVEVYNSLGIKILEQNDVFGSVDLSRLPAATYRVRLMAREGKQTWLGTVLIKK